MIIKTLAITFFFLLYQAIVLFASENGGNETSTWTGFFWNIVNFLILVGILYYFGRKPLVAFFSSRSKVIEKTLEEAKEARNTAWKALAEVEKRFREKDREVNEIIEASIRVGEMERDKAIDDGKRKKANLLSHLQVLIDLELKKAKDEIRKEAVESAFTYAQKELALLLTDEKKEKLLTESLNKLSRKA